MQLALLVGMMINSVCLRSLLQSLDQSLPPIVLPSLPSSLRSLCQREFFKTCILAIELAFILYLTK